ncbi:acyltransferase family protein [Variovorax boronicumulans]|uniref:acyltransferase family protein n=1 Tax=Variovorax boronicumulans TaxID=436515 RepID=UPI00278874E5|nr:acyltransferase [Variovorax boronicumulans]MDQ0042688.1 peptidoglycan/LPS O-acetylase OafA/YrhL [Variovorax boronicumulans]
MNKKVVPLTFPRENNLEWMRLLFALQVVLVHGGEHLGAALPGIDIIRHFPGVPAFFFVSGFLIYASYVNAPDRRYFENRFLRLFPGLVFVTLGGVGVALVAHDGNDLVARFSSYVIWFFAQTTLGQAYNPAFLRDVGVGVINGSLWTLTTEILFYLCVPVIVWMERRIRYTVPILAGLSFAIYAAGPVLSQTAIYREKSFYDLIALTPIAWGWMFGAGILAVKHFSAIQRHMRLLPLAVVPLVGLMFVGSGALFGSSGNRLGLVYFLLYAALVLWCAFGTPFRGLRIDLSYGAYVWHMPVINLLLVLSMPSLPVALLLTLMMACLSWFLIERPSLRLKRSSLKPLSGDEITVPQPSVERA